MRQTSLILCFCVGIYLITLASRPSTPPTHSELVGLWAGYEHSFPYFYRLNLREDSSGALVILYPEGKPDVYNLRWEFAKLQLLIKASPINNDTEKIACSVSKVNHRQIDLVISGKGWKRNALLVNERQLASKIAESRKHEPR